MLSPGIATNSFEWGMHTYMLEREGERKGVSVYIRCTCCFQQFTSESSC